MILIEVNNVNAVILEKSKSKLKFNENCHYCYYLNYHYQYLLIK